MVFAEGVERVLDQVPALDGQQDRDASIGVGPSHVVGTTGGHEVIRVTRDDFLDPADLRSCRGQTGPGLDGPRRPNSEKHGVDAAFAKAWDIDMSVRAAVRQVEPRIHQALRGVTVGVYHQRLLVEPSRLSEVLVIVGLHGREL